MEALEFWLFYNHQIYKDLMPKNEMASKRKLLKKMFNGSNEREFVAIVQPITGGKAPAAPPITIFCGVNLFNQTCINQHIKQDGKQ